MKPAQLSARLNPDMGTKPSSEGETQRAARAEEQDGMAVLSYILAGLIFYGGLGWAGNHFFHTTWLLPAGLILGLVSSTYLIIKRYGSGT